MLVLGAPGALGGDRLPGPISATVERVIDGDTFEVRAQIWLDQELHVAVRAKGVDTPELNRARCAQERADGAAAHAFLEGLIGGKEVELRDIEHDKYGHRVGATVTLANGTDLAALLIKAGHGMPYNGGRRADHCALDETAAD